MYTEVAWFRGCNSWAASSIDIPGFLFFNIASITACDISRDIAKRKHCMPVDSRLCLRQPKGKPRFLFLSFLITLLTFFFFFTNDFVMQSASKAGFLSNMKTSAELPNAWHVCVVAQSMDRASALQSMDCPRKARIHTLSSAIYGFSQSMVCA